MGKQQKRNEPKAGKTAISQPLKRSKSKAAAPGGQLFDRLNLFLESRMKVIFWVLFAGTTLLSILLFDIRFSLTGDDSAYVIRAADFIRHFTYPGFQGPLYPIVLSPVVLIFGISAVPLKSLSILFLMGYFYFTYRAFRGRIPALLTVSVLLLSAVNAFILYYASQTYSEMFYMFLQAAAISFLFSRFIDDQPGRPLNKDVRLHLLLGLCILALGLTRSIGFTVALAIPAFFLLRGQWRHFLMVIASVALMLALFQGTKYMLWGSTDLTLSTQGGGLLNKDYYKPAIGKEDLSGFLTRMIQNSNSYLSRHFYGMLGIRPYATPCEPMTWLTVGTWLLFFSGAALFWRRNRYLAYLALHTFLFLTVSFLILQTRWDQSRIIIPVMTFLILILLAFFYYLLTFKPLLKLQWIFPVGMVVLLGFSLAATSNILKEVRKIDGIYYGLTPDWENYVKMSKWASDNLPDSAVVACRKPSISFIYGGKGTFFGITQLPNYPVKQLFDEWKAKKAGYIMISSSDLAGKEVSKELFRTFKNGLIADVIRQGQVNYIVNIPDTLREKTILELETMKIRWRTDVDSLKMMYTETGGYYVVYPDSLKEMLRKGRVTHVMTANLRSNPNEKTKQTVNTVERFVGIISDKYPYFMTKVVQLGSDENEPAAIYKVDYTKCVPFK